MLKMPAPPNAQKSESPYLLPPPNYLFMCYNIPMNKRPLVQANLMNKTVIKIEYISTKIEYRVSMSGGASIFYTKNFTTLKQAYKVFVEKIIEEGKSVVY